MKNLTQIDKVRENALSVPQAGGPEIQTAQTADPGSRSHPLRSTYNSTFIILVLAIAVLLAVTLLIWPAGGL